MGWKFVDHPNLNGNELNLLTRLIRVIASSVTIMAREQETDEDAHFALSKLAERLEHVANQDRETRTSPRGFKRFG